MLDIDNWQIHHDFNKNRLQTLFDTGVTLGEEDCPCEDCIKLFANKVEPSLMDKAMALSTRLTFAMLPVHARHLTQGSKSYEDLRHKFGDNFTKGGWD